MQQQVASTTNTPVYPQQYSYRGQYQNNTGGNNTYYQPQTYSTTNPVQFQLVNTSDSKRYRQSTVTPSQQQVNYHLHFYY